MRYRVAGWAILGLLVAEGWGVYFRLSQGNSYRPDCLFLCSLDLSNCDSRARISPLACTGCLSQVASACSTVGIVTVRSGFAV